MNLNPSEATLCTTGCAMRDQNRSLKRSHARVDVRRRFRGCSIASGGRFNSHVRGIYLYYSSASRDVVSKESSK